MRRFTATAAVAAAGVLAGCGVHVHVSAGAGNSGVSTTYSSSSAGPILDTVKLQALVQEVTKRRGLAAASVTCPVSIPQVFGMKSTCTATYKGGETGAFRATQTDASGSVHVDAAEVIAPEIEDEIEHFLIHPAYAAKAICPSHQPIIVGQKFKCTATAGTHSFTFLARIIDTSGGVHLDTLAH